MPPLFSPRGSREFAMLSSDTAQVPATGLFFDAASPLQKRTGLSGKGVSNGKTNRALTIERLIPPKSRVTSRV